MNPEDKLIAEAFSEQFGQTTPPKAESLGNYKCCDECKERCERLSATDLDGPEIGAYAYEIRMGSEAYQFIVPSLITVALSDPDEHLEYLFDKLLNPARYRDLQVDQLRALHGILEFISASGYRSDHAQDRIREHLGYMDCFIEHGQMPWEINSAKTGFGRDS